MIQVTVQRTFVQLVPEEQPPIQVAVTRRGVTFAPYGPQGIPGPASAFYEHTQSTPATLWTIAHNLGFRPSVAVTTTGGVEVLADVQHLSENTLTVTFLVAMAGIARLT